MSKLTNKKKRTQRVRFKIKKKANLRLSLFRSNKFIYAQLIDDSVGKTLLSSSSIQKAFKETKGSPKQIAFKVGESIGNKILENKINKFTQTLESLHFNHLKRICKGSNLTNLQKSQLAFMQNNEEIHNFNVRQISSKIASSRYKRVLYTTLHTRTKHFIFSS